MKIRIGHLFVLLLLWSGVLLRPVSASAQPGAFTTLHSFAALSSSTNSDGAFPWAALVLSGNRLYGTTYNGGVFSNGTVFAVNTDGTGFTNLHTFSVRAGLRQTNYDGGQPVAGLVLSGSTLYGTTGIGGTNGRGTVYAINTDGSGFTVLHYFGGNSDGAATTAGLVLSGGTLYGASQGGGSSGLGMLFSLNTDGSDYTNLFSFPTETGGINNEGGQPLAGMVIAGTNLFGTTWSGGTGGQGVVFRINTDGTGYTNLHSFTALVSGTNSDGAVPFGGLTLAGDTLFGGTVYGGAGGKGVLFKLNPDGSGFANLHSFTALINQTNSDGTAPYGRLFPSGNTLYGTATGGGGSTNGTIFTVNTDGANFRVLYHFSRYGGTTNSDGAGPVSGILSSNTLYGVAHTGGSGGSGTVFSLFIPPELGIGLSGTNTILTWPTNADGFVLQATTNLADPLAWSSAMPPPAQANGQYAVTNTLSAGRMFYRLAR
jgi:uncharacterized repeat protein (TIGR03803 family)